MKKTLLTERFQELAGIRPLYGNKLESINDVNEREGAASNLELKSLAKQLFLRFKNMGADVELTNDRMVINKAKIVMRMVK